MHKCSFDSSQQFWLTTINKWGEIAFPSHVKGINAPNARAARTHTHLHKTFIMETICKTRMEEEPKNIAIRLNILVHAVIKNGFFRLFINGYYLRSAHHFQWGNSNFLYLSHSLRLSPAWWECKFFKFSHLAHDCAKKGNQNQVNTQEKNNHGNFNPSHFYLTQQRGGK